MVNNLSFAKNDKNHSTKQANGYAPYQKSEAAVMVDEGFYNNFSKDSKKIRIGTYFSHAPWPKGKDYASKYFEIGAKHLAFIVVHDPEQPEETDSVVKSISLYTAPLGKKEPATDLNLYLNGYSEGTHYDLRSEIKDLNSDKVPEIIQLDYGYEHNETSPSKPKVKVFTWRENKFVEANELIEKVRF